MNENVNVCITPKGEKPVLHFSQFDNGRIFTVTVLADDGVSAAVLTDLDIEFRLRKTDSHVVTVAPESVTDNVITFKNTEQMCACCGQNIASVVLMDDDSNIISTLDILVDIQRDILSGGLTSESDIRNLTTQIEQIVPEVIGDDYYTKTEVDELIADIPTFDPTNYYDKNYINTMYWTAQQCDRFFYRKTYIDANYYTKIEVDNLINSIPTFDPTNYYNKSDVDGLLADKADADDVYTKTETDNLLADKADTSDIPDSINELSDVNTAGAVNGNALIYNNGTWVPGSGGGGSSVDYSNYSDSYTTMGSDYETLRSLVLDAGLYIVNCCIYGKTSGRKYIKITTDDTDTSNANSSMCYASSSPVDYSLNCTRLLKITATTTLYIKVKIATTGNNNLNYDLEIIKFT